MQNNWAVKNVPPVMVDLWLWLSNHELVWFVAALNIAWICSQLWWGWGKYLREKKGE